MDSKEIERVEKAREIIAEIRSMKFDGKVDSILEKALVDIVIYHYRKYYSVEDEDFNEIFEELYGVENYIEEYF